MSISQNVFWFVRLFIDTTKSIVALYLHLAIIYLKLMMMGTGRPEVLFCVVELCNSGGMQNKKRSYNTATVLQTQLKLRC